MIGLRALAAHQTVEIDVKAIRDNQIPDETGKVLPINTTRGQIQWTVRARAENEHARVPENLGLIGQSEQHDAARGMNSTYYCENCCPGSYAWSIILPTNSEIAFEVGKTIVFVHIEVQDNCYGAYYQFDTTSQVSWSSTVTAVAVMSGNVATVAGAGTTQIKATFVASFSAPIPCTGGDPEPFAAEPGSELDFISTFARRPRGPSVEEDLMLMPPLYNRAVKLSSSPARSLFIPTCGTCVWASATVSPGTSLIVRPKVSIDSFKAVGKDQTAKIKITVTSNPNNENITLTLEPNSGTGLARFTSSNNTTMTIQQTTDVEIKGITESSTNNNMRLKASINGFSYGGGEDFTVVKVTLSVNFTSGQTVSSDNHASAEIETQIGTTGLGGPAISTGLAAHLMRQKIEIKATILPSDWDGPAKLQRERVENRRFNDQTLEIRQVGCPDTTSDISLMDTNPQSDNSQGKIYDYDAPGILLGPTNPVGTKLRRRTNFRQWLTVNQNNGTGPADVRLSADINWYERISVILNSGGVNAVLNDVTGDNVLGSGSTNLGWDLSTGGSPSSSPC